MANYFLEQLLYAAKIITSSPYDKLGTQLYSSFDSGNGKAFEAGKLDLHALYKIDEEKRELSLQSGKQELFENILINTYNIFFELA